jgi:hypothetical protein
MPYYAPVVAVPVAEVLALNEVRPYEEMLGAGGAEWNPELGPLLFVSHQWTSYAEPDHSGKQLALLQAALRQVAEGTFKADGPLQAQVSASDRDVTADYYAHLDALVNCPTGAWVWMDYWSIPQRDQARQTRAIRSIPAYLEVSGAMISLTPPTKHKENFEVCDAASYGRRGWCRLESRGFLMRRYIVGRYPPFYSFSDADRVGQQDAALQEAMQDRTFFRQGESIFNGTFSCCQLGHADRHGAPMACDKERLAPVVEALHASQCEALRARGELATWRRLLAQRWVWFAGLPRERLPTERLVAVGPRKRSEEEGGPDEVSDGARVAAFLGKYALQSPTERAAGGNTALHYAAYEDSAAIIPLLVAAGADPDAGDDAPEGRAGRGGVTPLFLCALNGCAAAAAALVDSGADVDQQADVGATPLFGCVWCTDAESGLEIAQMLVEVGAATETVTNERAHLPGCTPLLAAAWRDNVPMVRFLLEACARNDARVTRGPHAGKDALELATEKGASEATLALLREACGMRE